MFPLKKCGRLALQLSLALLMAAEGAAEQSVRFSPAFIFSNLARGPPKSAWNKHLLCDEGLCAQGPLARRLMQYLVLILGF